MFIGSQGLHWGDHLHLSLDNLASSYEKVVYDLEGEMTDSDRAQILLDWELIIY